MKRVGIYLESDRACGGAHQYNRVMVEALARLPKDKFEVVAIYSAQHWRAILEKANLFSEFCEVPSFFRRLTGMWRRLRLPLSLWRKLSVYIHPLARHMKQMNCDLWIFPSQDAFAYWMPFVSLTTIHDLMHRYETRFPEVGSPKEYRWREFHYSQTCRFAAGILVDSPLGKQHVMDCYDVNEGKCHVLPYIPPLNFSDHSMPLAELKFPLPKKYLFYPAQFWKHKNHANLLKAIATLKNELPDLHLVLVGSPKNGMGEVSALIQELNISDRVHILGLVEDSVMATLYQHARALVMPTFFGPTNIPPLEAFISGCPVIISDIYAMRDQLGEAALYCNPLSIEELSNCIKNIWLNDDLYHDLVAKGKNKINQFTLNAFSLQLNKIIETCVS
jgi:glycosyltransferase involved in cell wall biosynthesis